MIQDISPSKYHVEFENRPMSENTPCFVFKGRQVLECWKEGMLTLPEWKELEDIANESYPLFRIDDTMYGLVFLKEDARIPENYHWQETRTDRDKKTKVLRFAESTAYHLNVWYSTSRFCGRCGTRTEPDTKERMLRCPKCGNMIYPRISPAVIVGITDGERILMTRYSGRAYKGYALVAGFTEIGETPEDTVRREVKEEVGLTVKDMFYFDSQPWGVESDLLLGYFAMVDGNETIRLDENELAQAGWYYPDEIDVEYEDYALTNYMITAFKNGHWRKGNH